MDSRNRALAREYAKTGDPSLLTRLDKVAARTAYEADITAEMLRDMGLRDWVYLFRVKKASRQSRHDAIDGYHHRFRLDEVIEEVGRYFCTHPDVSLTTDQVGRRANREQVSYTTMRKALNYLKQAKVVREMKLGRAFRYQLIVPRGLDKMGWQRVYAAYVNGNRQVYRATRHVVTYKYNRHSIFGTMTGMRFHRSLTKLRKVRGEPDPIYDDADDYAAPV